jgi:hypothetical protein
MLASVAEALEMMRQAFGAYRAVVTHLSPIPQASFSTFWTVPRDTPTSLAMDR